MYSACKSSYIQKTFFGGECKKDWDISSLNNGDGDFCAVQGEQLDSFLAAAKVDKIQLV